MKEFKFRAWDRDDKTMFVPNNICHTRSGIEYTRELSDGMNIKRYWQGESPNNVFLMQYTGQKDKNGKEIYECDIVRYCYDGLDFKLDKVVIKEVITVVKWSNYYLSFMIENETCYLWNKINEIEVIGNIYENPELLERID